MKNVAKSVVLLLTCFSVSAQLINSAGKQELSNVGKTSVVFDNGTQVKALKNDASGRSQSRGIRAGAATTVLIDYDFVDEMVTTDSGGTYISPIGELLNSDYLENDVSVNGLNWLFWRVDSLYDANTLTSYRYDRTQVRIDSITYFFAHGNVSGTENLIVANIYEYANVPFGLDYSGQRQLITNNILFTDTIRTSTALGASEFTILSNTISPNLTLPLGTRFAVGIHYHGDITDHFRIIAGYGDRCSSNCVAHPSAFDLNTWYRHIFHIPGEPPFIDVNNIGFDCDNNGVVGEPEKCEDFGLQNAWLQAHLTLADTCPVAQNIPLVNGWNMISSYIDSDKPNMADVFSDILSSVLIVKDGDGQAYIPSFGINAIGNWNVEKGYKAKTSNAVTLTMGCEQVDPINTPISLSAGWDIISFLRTSALDVPTAVSSILPNLIIIKDGNGKAYIPSFGINTIGDMVPGQGYKIKMSAADTLVYPAN